MGYPRDLMATPGIQLSGGLPFGSEDYSRYIRTRRHRLEISDLAEIFQIFLNPNKSARDFRTNRHIPDISELAEIWYIVQN